MKEACNEFTCRVPSRRPDQDAVCRPSRRLDACHRRERRPGTTFQDKLGGAEFLAALKSGGLVIFIRHAETERDCADQVSAIMGDCSTQRPLSETGWQQARAIGKAFEALRIPVGEVHSSEYCRAWQTADLAFGRYRKTPDLNFEPAEEYSDEQVAAMRERMASQLAAVPKD